MKKNILDPEDDELLRNINGAILYSTALLVESDDYKLKAQRILTDFSGSTTSMLAVTVLEENVKKETPDGGHSYAIGSHHALNTFANSALTRRNVNDMSIPTWGKYSINTFSYLSASGSALTRIQDGGHSFSDQLISVSLGNFIGLFFYEAFLGNDEKVEVSAHKNSFIIKTTWNF